MKCNNCGTKISNNSKFCTECGETIENDDLGYAYLNPANPIEKNINYFIKLATIIKKLLFALSFIMFFAGLISVEESEDMIMLFFVLSIIFIAIAILSTPFLEWKAFMLQTSYESKKK